MDKGSANATLGGQEPGNERDTSRSSGEELHQLVKRILQMQVAETSDTCDKKQASSSDLYPGRLQKRFGYSFGKQDL